MRARCMYASEASPSQVCLLLEGSFKYPLYHVCLYAIRKSCVICYPRCVSRVPPMMSSKVPRSPLKKYLPTRTPSRYDVSNGCVFLTHSMHTSFLFVIGMNTGDSAVDVASSPCCRSSISPRRCRTIRHPGAAVGLHALLKGHLLGGTRHPILCVQIRLTILQEYLGVRRLSPRSDYHRRVLHGASTTSPVMED